MWHLVPMKLWKHWRCNPTAEFVVGGQFTQANGVTRNRITRLLTTGAADPSINFGDGANGDIDAVYRFNLLMG